MRQYTTQGIILSRTDYGEADRILTFITPDHGKITAIAKGVRKAKAKLAGAIELFSVSELTMVVGRGEVETLISARLARHYGNIVNDLNRTNMAYEFLRIINKATEDKPEEAYFTLLDKALTALDDTDVTPELTELWFKMQLLKITGHTPNLSTDEAGKKLSESKKYNFDYEKMRFTTNETGEYGARHIKFLRLSFGKNTPKALSRIDGIGQLVQGSIQLIQTALQTHIRI